MSDRIESPAETLVRELAMALSAYAGTYGSNMLPAGLLARAAAFHDHAPALADALRDIKRGRSLNGDYWVRALAAYDADMQANAANADREGET